MCKSFEFLVHVTFQINGYDKLNQSCHKIRDRLDSDLLQNHYGKVTETGSADFRFVNAHNLQNIGLISHC